MSTSFLRKGLKNRYYLFLRMSPRKEMSQLSFFVKWAKNRQISKHLYSRKHVHLRYFSIQANSIEINIILLINIKLLRHKTYRKNIHRKTEILRQAVWVLLSPPFLLNKIHFINKAAALRLSRYIKLFRASIGQVFLAF